MFFLDLLIEACLKACKTEITTDLSSPEDQISKNRANHSVMSIVTIYTHQKDSDTIGKMVL